MINNKTTSEICMELGGMIVNIINLMHWNGKKKRYLKDWVIVWLSFWLKNTLTLLICNFVHLIIFFLKYDYWGYRCVCVMDPRSCISKPHLFATTTFNITIGVFRLLFLKYPHFFLLNSPFYPLLWWERQRIFVLCSHRTLNSNNK